MKKKFLFAIFIPALALVLTGCSGEKKESSNVDTNNKVATIKTAKGEIEIDLLSSAAPKSVDNFVKKAESGYYKGLTFHRVEDWVIQGGDPKGDGTGGGDQPTELSDTPFKEGSVGVARGGDINISNDSQFFICVADCSWLTGQYTIFGQVKSGLDVAKKIEKGEKIEDITIK